MIEAIKRWWRQLWCAHENIDEKSALTKGPRGNTYRLYSASCNDCKKQLF
jgi:hypothetical protein